MNAQDLLKSSPREFDARVARLLPQVESVDDAGSVFWEGQGWIPCPYFHSDPAADYSVLETVRKEWIFSKRRAFQRALESIGNARLLTAPGRVATPEDATTQFDPMELWMRYQPGDYSLAALMVREGEG